MSAVTSVSSPRRAQPDVYAARGCVNGHRITSITDTCTIEGQLGIFCLICCETLSVRRLRRMISLERERAVAIDEAIIDKIAIERRKQGYLQPLNRREMSQAIAELHAARYSKTQICYMLHISSQQWLTCAPQHVKSQPARV